MRTTLLLSLLFAGCVSEAPETNVDRLHISRFEAESPTFEPGGTASFVVELADTEIDPTTVGEIWNHVGQRLGTFASTGATTYELDLPWSTMERREPTELDIGPPGRAFVFLAVFRNDRGHIAVGTTEVMLGCGERGVCDGACRDLGTVSDCGGCGRACASGEVCDAGACIAAP